jgi:hypothetical protein
MHKLVIEDPDKERRKYAARHKSLVELVTEVHSVAAKAKASVVITCMVSVVTMIMSALTVYSAAKICM